MKKHVCVGAMIVCATNVIYSRIIGLQASTSTLKRHLQVETSSRDTNPDNSLNIDGSAMRSDIPGLVLSDMSQLPLGMTRRWLLLG